MSADYPGLLLFVIVEHNSKDLDVYYKIAKSVKSKVDGIVKLNYVKWYSQINTSDQLPLSS
jgi:hypothetical protein